MAKLRKYLTLQDFHGHASDVETEIIGDTLLSVAINVKGFLLTVDLTTGEVSYKGILLYSNLSLATTIKTYLSGVPALLDTSITSAAVNATAEINEAFGRLP